MRQSNREKFIDGITYGDKWWWDRKIKIINTYLENPEKYGNENLIENWETLGQTILEKELWGSKWMKQYQNRTDYLKMIVNVGGNKWFNKICNGYGLGEMMKYIKSKEKKGKVFLVGRPTKSSSWFDKKGKLYKEILNGEIKEFPFIEHQTGKVLDWSLLSETEMYGWNWFDYQNLEDELNKKLNDRTTTRKRK
jgi:hypothetical protein